MQINAAIRNGVKLFIQLTGFSQHPTEAKWVKNEFDLRVELDRIADLVEDTRDMLGRQMYRNQEYKFAEDAKKTLEEALLRDEDEKQTAIKRKHNMAMFHTVLEPVLDTIGATMTHEQALEHAREFTDSVWDYVNTVSINHHLDDAVVAQAIVRREVKIREQERKAALEAQARERRRKKKKDAELEELLPPPEEDVVDDM